jgi:hypothetical protein
VKKKKKNHFTIMRENLSNLLKELKRDPRTRERKEWEREGKKSSITNHNNIDFILLRNNKKMK